MDAVASPSFVGRRSELAALDDALDKAVAGHTTIVLIGGEAGLGKTRLPAEWNERASASGARVASGVALDLGEQGPPYLAIAAGLRELLADFDPDQLDLVLGRDRSILGRVLPELIEPSTADASNQPTQLAQIRLFHRFIDVLDRASVESPIVLELEDLHWADPSTRAFLQYLVEVADESRLLVIGTYRTEEASPSRSFATTLRQLRRRPRVRLLQLEPFTRAEVRDQLIPILGVSPSNALLDAIVLRSEGNALFVEELAASPNPQHELPTSVSEAIASKVTTLQPDTQAVLRVTSVIGRSATDASLRTVAQLGDADFELALREAVDVRLLEPDEAADGYRFRHALFQEAIYRATLPGERRRLHAAVASALVGDERWTHDGALAAEVARHAYAAREWDLAFRASVIAGSATAAQAAYAESLTHYDRAVEAWNRASDRGPDVRRSAILVAASGSAYLAGNPAKALAYAEEAIAGLGNSPDPTLQLDTLVSQKNAMRAIGGDDRPIARQIGALDATGRPPRERIRILEERADAIRDDDPSGALALALEVQSLSEADGDPLLIARSCALLGEALYFQDPAAAAAAFERGLAAAIESGDLPVEASLRRDVSEALSYQNLYEELLVTLEEAIESAEQNHLGRMARPYLHFQKGLALLKLGRLEEARLVVAEGLADEPLGVVLWQLHMVGAEVATATGDFDVAAAHVAAARTPGAVVVDEAERGFLATVRGNLAFAERRFDEVVEIVEPVLRRIVATPEFVDDPETAWWLAELGLAATAELAESAMAMGNEIAQFRARQSATMLLDLLEQARRKREALNVRDIGKTDRYDLLIQGHLGRLDGHDDPAPWAAAAAAFPPTSIESLTAVYRQAEAMLAGKVSRDEVAAVLAPAHAAAVAIGARPLASRMAELARRARITFPAPEPVPNAEDDAAADAAGVEAADPPSGLVALQRRGLSEREVEVLTLVAAGYSNREIGERLFITTKTASVHVTHILVKLGVTSRTQAATVGVRLGLPEVEGADSPARVTVGR